MCLAKLKICARKTAYRLESDAWLVVFRASRNTKRRSTRRLVVYKCDQCGLWHVGHKPRTKGEINRKMWHLGHADDRAALAAVNDESWRLWLKSQGRWAELRLSG